MINGNILRDAIISGANNIANCKHRVDELNIFPVPDGDTGTNMSMSMGNAARELARLDGETVGKVSEVAASALLRGARGNSGVITSIIFRGFARGFKDADVLTPENIRDAFKYGVEAAYKAVMKPTEGTILTVVRVAAEYAETAVNDGKDEKDVFLSALEGANKALAETPEILPVLKKAGVVDAGGKGLCVILEGMRSVLIDGVMIKSEEIAESEITDTARNAAGEVEAEINFTYCTEFIVNRNPEVTTDPAQLRNYLESIGDCVVVVDDEQIIKVHFHTEHPGNGIEKGITFGPLVNLKIENMRDQHERAKHDAREKKTVPATNIERTETYTPAAPEKPVGFVSVSVGDGIRDLFTDLGVDKVVSGGQTMNPSTDDILKAIELTPAETVFVLPNNKNIIMAAEQAVPISTKKVIVLHTRTIPEGISAMLAFDPEKSNEDNAIMMRTAYEKVATGQITFAARDSDFDGHDIKKGELLALDNGKVSFVDTDISHCLLKLTKQLVKRTSSFVTVLYGEDVTEEAAAEAEKMLNEKFAGKVEFTFVNGKQPIYYYIISVE